MSLYQRESRLILVTESVTECVETFTHCQSPTDSCCFGKLKWELIHFIVEKKKIEMSTVSEGKHLSVSFSPVSATVSN